MIGERDKLRFQRSDYFTRSDYKLTNIRCL